MLRVIMSQADIDAFVTEGLKAMDLSTVNVSLISIAHLSISLVEQTTIKTSIQYKSCCCILLYLIELYSVFILHSAILPNIAVHCIVFVSR